MQQYGTFLWHDYETFGRDPARERPVQFAAIRTDADLNPVDELMIYCRQTADYLPDPESCLVHGVLPQIANEKGLCEHDFATEIHRQMSQPQTCVAGYNNIRFDDEFTRQLLFRNLFDPYAREWQNGNSRWDLIDVVRLTRALRPEGINWPTDDQGNPSNKLELLTRENDIEHGDAHDALADVRATIAVARLIKQKQPKLFDYALQMRKKQRVTQALDIAGCKPVLHVSGMYPGRDFNLSIVAPLYTHPGNPNGVLAYDLRRDPAALIELDAEAVAERLFTKAELLPDKAERIAIKTIHINRCPAIAPLSTLTDENKARLSLDVQTALKHRDTLLENLDSITAKLTTVFTRHTSVSQNDPELTLYSGSFANEHDRQLMSAVQHQFARGCPDSSGIHFQDPRLNQLFLRLRARNHPHSLSDTEVQLWKTFCNSRVHHGREGFRSHSEFERILDKIHSDSSDDKAVALVAALRAYGNEVAGYSRDATLAS
jgi:exodeoxyribonuclease-1